MRAGRDPLKLDCGRIHKGLAVDNGTGFENFHLDLDPLCPRFRLLNILIDCQDMLYPFAFILLLFWSGCENKMMVQLGVDSWYVEVMLSRIKFYDILEGHHGDLK